MSHQIQWHGRWSFLVSSASRKGMFHLVDLEPELLDSGEVDPKGRPFKCSCEADAYNVERPCRHVRAALRYVRPIIEHLAKFSGSYDTIPPKRKYTLKP